MRFRYIQLLSGTWRAVLAVMALLIAIPSAALADNNITVLNKLNNDNVYIAPAVRAAGHAARGDAAKIQRTVDQAGKHGVPVKVALVMQYPSTIKSPEDGADHLRGFLDFSGVLVLVTPHGVGVSSDYFGAAYARKLERQAAPLCASSYTACAVEAVQASVPKVQAEQSAANRNVAIFWAVAVIVFGALVAVLVLAARRRQDQIVAESRVRAGDETPGSTAPEAG